MKAIAIVGSGLPAVLAKLEFKSAEMFTSTRSEKWRRKRAWRGFGVNYLDKPMGLPCKPVRVITHMDYQPVTEDGLNMYAVKSGSKPDIPFGEVMGHVPTGWPDIQVNFGLTPTKIDTKENTITFHGQDPWEYTSIIWTDPLTDLLRVLGLNQGFDVPKDFPSRPVFVRVTIRPPDAPFGGDVYYVNYLSNPSVACHRFCDKDGERHYEGLTMMGSIPHKRTTPGRMSHSPVAAGVMKELQEQGIYCIGEVARWSHDETLTRTWERLQRLREVV